MRALVNRSFTRAAWSAAIVTLLLFSRSSWGQETKPNAPSTDLGPLLVPDQDDDAFDHHASIRKLASAWRDMNSSLMTDAALQFVEGERVLLRSHKAIKASQVIDLAIRLATENRDKESLSRIAKALDRSGDKERLAQVNLALKTAGAARAVEPTLNEGSLNARLAIRAVLEEIQSAQVAGDKVQLDSLEATLVNLPINDKQQASLKKAIAEARESLVDNKETATAIAFLDEIGGIRRHPDVITPQEFAKFSPEYGKEPFTEAQIDEIIKVPGKSPAANDGNIPLLPEGLEFLERKSRGKYLFGNNVDGARFSKPPGLQKERTPGPKRRSGTNIGIWEYGNYSKSPNNTCGQAAVATLLSYHSPVAFPPISGEKYVENLYYGFGPNVAFGMFGTGWDQMQKAVKANGLNYAWIKRADFDRYVKAGYPVAVMLDIAEDRAGWIGKSGGHWTVIYAADDNGYYLTNWPDPKTTKCNFPVQRSYFDKGHTSWLTDKAGTSGLGLLTW